MNSRKVDEFVDDSAWHEVEWAFPGLVEVVGDQRVHPDAQVVLHEHLTRGLSQHPWKVEHKMTKLIWICFSILSIKISQKILK